jgi:alpha-1,2-glucosyltransferase
VREVPRDILILSGFLVLIIGLSLFAVWGTSPLVDEYGHKQQIEWFVDGNFALVPSQSMGPGYQAVIASLAKLTNSSDLASLRFFSACLSFASVLLFYFTSKLVTNEANLVRAMQFALLPVLFPYFARVYSDIFGFFCILLCYYFQLKNRVFIAGLAGLLGLITRQTNIVWIGMFFLLGYHTANGFTLSWDRLKRHIVKLWPYCALFLLFAIFVLINKRVALGAKNDEQYLFLQMNNIIFLLIVFGICFLPLMVANAAIMTKCLVKTKAYIVLLICFIVYWYSFHDLHPWNDISCNFRLLRNIPLMWITSDSLYKILFFIPVFLSVLYIWVYDSTNNAIYFLGLFSLFLLSVTFLVEPRYYIPSMAFYLLFRESHGGLKELILTGYLAIISFVLLYFTVAYNCVL